MTKLSVNVNRVALLRNSRPLPYPSPVRLSRIALEAGAHGITVHPRPDERHIRPSDVDEIAALLREPAWRETRREFNIEGNPFEGPYMEHCRRTRPTQATLVPDTPGQATSDHGWLLDDAAVKRLKPVVRDLRTLGCRVSLFMDAMPETIVRAAETGCDRVELYTEPYASAAAGGDASETLDRFAAAAEAAHAVGLGINAGHDLSLENLAMFVRAVPWVEEVSIGHALTADALELGMAGAVRAYLGQLAGGTNTT